MNPSCSPRASSISLPVPPPPNPQDKSFSYSNNSSFDVDPNSHPIKVKCAPLVPCSDYIKLAPAKNPTTPPVPICNLDKVKCKNGTFAGRFKFPTLLLSNA